MLKENIGDFSERLKGKIVIGKGYVSKDFAEELKKETLNSSQLREKT